MRKIINGLFLKRDFLVCCYIGGFTLAEVLITLGIIGIVAAITIPTLVSNYQKTQYVTQLKKAYNTFSNGLKAYMANQGVTNIVDTDLFDGETAFDDEGRQNKIDALIKKSFSTIKTCKVGDSSCQISTYSWFNDMSASGIRFTPDLYSFCTADGMCFSLYLTAASECTPDYSAPGPMKAYCGNLEIDINGAQKPNLYGRDYFVFVLGHDGNIFPTWGIPYAKYNLRSDDYKDQGEYWQDEPADYCGKIGNPDVSTSSGDGCAARIMEEGWQMNY